MKKKEVPIDKQSRRRYDAEFKASALRMIAQGRSFADVSRSLGIHESLLHKWKSADSEGPVKSDSVEVDKLLRYINQLEIEREILEKALSIFSRPT